MLNSLNDIDARIIQGYLSENDVAFIRNINSKQEAIDKEIKELDENNKRINKKIAKDKKLIKKRTRAFRRYVENTEAVTKSIESVRNNLNELKANYKNIGESLIRIARNNNNNPEIGETKPEIDALVERINDTEALKQRVKEDNEKNYLIINNFINDIMNEDSITEEGNSLYNLTIDTLQDNPVLKICERRVELPYTKKEVENYMREYPEEYKTVQDVIVKEFMVNISLFNKHPILSRLKETYYLCRTKEMMPILESFNYAKNIMFRSDINPYIIAAVKSKKQLEDYIRCLEENNLENYSYFKIIYEINPLSI